MGRQLSQSKREDVLDAYGRECAFCGISEEEHKEERGRSLEVHHIVPQRAHGSDDEENLIAVCISCHGTLESTQAEALARIKSDNGGDKVGELEDEIEKLNAELEEAEEKIKSAHDCRWEEANEHSESLEAFEKLVNEKLSTTVYVVHETRLTTSRLLYAGVDKDAAVSAFEGAEKHVTMETVNVSIDDWLGELPEKILKEVATESELLPEYRYHILVGDSADEQ